MSNLSRATLYREIARGYLRMVKVGKRSLIPADALEKLCGMVELCKAARRQAVER
jgi:excisionase family DNA binding protein